MVGGRTSRSRGGPREHAKHDYGDDDANGSRRFADDGKSAKTHSAHIHATFRVRLLSLNIITVVIIYFVCCYLRLPRALHHRRSAVYANQWETLMARSSARDDRRLVVSRRRFYRSAAIGLVMDVTCRHLAARRCTRRCAVRLPPVVIPRVADRLPLSPREAVHPRIPML